MFLYKLELQGFKSFVEKTDLLFSDGITGVIGPNGCGKTNVSDAIRWVMGEQSAQATARRFHGRRDLQWLAGAQAPGVGRSPPHVQERPRPAAHRVLGSDHFAPRVPLRHERVLPQQDAVPPEGHPRSLLRHRHGQPRLFGDRAADGGQHPVRQHRTPPLPVRGGLGYHQVQVAQERGALQAGRHRSGPHALERHRVRDRARIALAGAPGRQGPQVPAAARPGARPGPPAHRRPRHSAAGCAKRKRANNGRRRRCAARA